MHGNYLHHYRYITNTQQSEIDASDILLLLRKTDIKRLGLKINIENHTLEVNRQRLIDLDITSTGHFFTPLK